MIMETAETKSYPSKVLLFGEYSILQGADAIALPNFNYTGRWDYEKISDQRLIDWCTFLEKIDEQAISTSLNLAKFREDLKKGLVFRSNIPGGYGLGSSGALSAGFLDRYAATKDLELSELREVLSVIESFFHGSSSGIDPLVSFLGKSLFIRKGQEVQIEPVSDLINKFRLYDSGESRHTASLVKTYQQKQQNDNHFRIQTERIAELHNSCIDAYRHGIQSALESAMFRLSEMQWAYMRWLIPEQMHKFWEEGLNTGKRIFKLCGAGGGGFFLVYDPTGFHEEVYPLERIPVQ